MGHSELQIDQQARQPFWMPFSPNKEFKQEPRLFVRAQGLYCYTPDGREVIDASSGLCSAWPPATAVPRSRRRSSIS
jgi:adenosylmethionine-8-amino-7-oxononanoate aminotransferase